MSLDYESIVRFIGFIFHNAINNCLVISINQCEVKGQAFKYTLMSRRSCYRAGTRYYMRGMDSEGHVANFVETEQIVEFSGIKCSFVQVLEGFH